jgi:enoyl-CoA hydratase
VAVDVDRRGAVTVITLNRPEAANSLDPETISGIGRALVDAEQDDSVRAVVLTGAGDRVFCAGMDLKAFTEGRRGGTGDGPGLEVLNRQVYPKPTIAAVNGAAVAGGFELAIACDLIVAADHARFGIPEVKRGLVAAGGGTRLPRRLPLAIALELGLTGDLIDAPRALALGVINRVVPGPDVLDTAIELADHLSENGPLALKVTKQLMYSIIGNSDWDAISEAVAPVFSSNDAIEGATAFKEKRTPHWTGT